VRRRLAGKAIRGVTQEVAKWDLNLDLENQESGLSDVLQVPYADPDPGGRQLGTGRCAESCRADGQERDADAA